MASDNGMRATLNTIYGETQGAQAHARVVALLASQPPAGPAPPLFSPQDAVLITYGDSLQAPDRPPLQALADFARGHLQGAFSAIHILPFFPWSSDDGFSVTDFMAVDPALGGWEDVRALGRDFHLMVDLVLNHVSAQSDWFRSYLAGRPGFADLAIEVDPAADLSRVTRPRSLPLLTEFRKADGSPVHLWTTFSPDQVDLNYRSLEVLERMLAVLLFYVAQGARLIRLDAVAYLWKQIGTTCIHLPQTLAMVRLLRQVLDQAAPGTLLITETNVPHAENLRYFGDGRNAAHLVYNFTLPPLLLHTLVRGDASDLARWARTLRPPSAHTAFFNFTASHDGIGVRPLEGVLPPAALEALIGRVAANGGRVSTRRSADGRDLPYELNITYFDALKTPGDGPDPHHVGRFLASQAIPLVLPGVPGVYLHSLLGSRNWQAGVAQTGQARTINREKLHLARVQAELADPSSLRARIFHPLRAMLRVRGRQPAFHPSAAFEILTLSPAVFGLLRVAPGQTICCLTNVTADAASVSLAPLRLNFPRRDLLSGRWANAPRIRLEPYQVLWLDG
ncbi:MAG: sugar phosphorylase [Desulfobacteraceae bacterium]|jgi:sucrose phosphorylase